MPVPVWLPGQTLTSSDINNWMVPLTSYKASGTPRTTTTTQTADPDLAVGFLSAGIWVIEAVIRFNGPAGNSLSWGWQTSATSIAGSICTLYNNTTPAVILSYHLVSYTGSLAQTTGTAPANEQSLRFNGMVQAGSAGTFAFAWAQGSSSATATTVDRASYLNAWRAN